MYHAYRWHRNLANAYAHLNIDHVCLIVGSFCKYLFAQGNISEDNICALTQASNEAADKEKLDMECSSSGRHTETLDCIVSSSLSCFVNGSIVALALCTWSIVCYLSF